MSRPSLVLGLAWLAALVVVAQLKAQESTTLEQSPDGVTYRVTRRVVQRSIPTTEYQTREHKSYRPQVTTEYKSYPQTYVAPVTEYQWVARQRGLWPFVQPYWSHELVPVTRWEARAGTVQLPVARTDWIEETRTTQVPVTTYRTVPEEHVSRVAVSATPASSGAIAGSSSTTNVALRPIGGQKMQSDPPRDGNRWGGTAGSSHRR